MTQPKPRPTPEQPEGTENYPTTPAEERGERIETGRQIARGAKPEGEVKGATGDDPDDPRSGND
ncbi:MAG TPA: hypothetical protein VM597_08210 [Gemmataceae bacterium]|nr:hypothetical protein [Gemmataceae bacterium]